MFKESVYFIINDYESKRNIKMTTCHKIEKQLIDKNLLIKGLYNIRMSWINNGTTYYQTFTYLVS